LALGVSLLLLGTILFRSLSTFQQVDASQDTRADTFAQEVLSAAPQDAILFTKGDRAVFALWYFHFALHERPDLSVISKQLLAYDWYQENLRATYPSLSMPGPILYPETIQRANPSRAICQVEYVARTILKCTKVSINSQ
jgi:hypothetical protein